MAYLSRRQLLAALPAVTFPFVAPQVAIGQQGIDDLITSADSIMYYRLLLEKIRADAVNFSAQGLSAAFTGCSSVLDTLKSILIQLRDKLNITANRRVSNLDEYIRRLEGNLALVQSNGGSSLENVLANIGPIRTVAVQELGREILADCDLKRQDVRELTDKMFRVIERYNQDFQRYSYRREQWSEKVWSINKAARECESLLDRATSSLAACAGAYAGAGPTASKNVKQAQQDISQLIDALSAIKVDPTTDAKWTLIRLLESIRKTMERDGLHQVSYDPLEPQTQIADTLPGISVKSSLVGKVSKIVKTPGFFKPGTTMQALACIAVCLPVWLSYQSSAERALRKQIIGAALLQHMVWGVHEEKVEEIASDLADAFPFSFFTT